jgi:hypothetical protein
MSSHLRETKQETFRVWPGVIDGAKNIRDGRLSVGAYVLGASAAGMSCVAEGVLPLRLVQNGK